MNVDPSGGLRNDYELKMNSYDLSVDIELADLIQRLRFEYPEVSVVVLTGGLDKVFCAGANIQMLASASHGHKVNFCKFTNETRNSIEDATDHSQQVWLAAVNGTAAGGGYELALACDEVLLVDDRSSAVSLPEIPLLAVLPGTGGLTRLVEKRHVRRDLADAFSTRSEGMRGQAAVDWRLVDRLSPASRFSELIDSRVANRAASSDRPANGVGLALTPLPRKIDGDDMTWSTVSVSIDRTTGTAEIMIAGPKTSQPATAADLANMGADAWLVSAARELDDAILHLRFNEPAVGTWVLRSSGDPTRVLEAESLFSGTDSDHWLVREVRLLWTRTLKRLDVSARTLVAVVEPGSCAVGLLAELVLAADRSFMLDGTWEDADESPPPATIMITSTNLGRLPMSNGLSRLATRFWGRDDAYAVAAATEGKELLAADAAAAELVTMTPDDLDWHDDLRLMVEGRQSFSPDAVTGMEANFRFVGPETMETKIFGRLSAWQNWIFQRPNAVGPEGALQRFGSGSRPEFDPRRV